MEHFAKENEHDLCQNLFQENEFRIYPLMPNKFVLKFYPLLDLEQTDGTLLSTPSGTAITTHYGFYEDAYLSSRSKITIFTCEASLGVFTPLE